MRGLLVAGGDTKTGLGIAQVRERLFVTSTCCDGPLFLDGVKRLACNTCQRIVPVSKGFVPPTYLVFDFNDNWVPSDVFNFVEDWTGMENGVDFKLDIEREAAF